METEFNDSHLNKRSPSPTAEQRNVTVSYNLTVTLLGSIVTFGGETKKIKIHTVITSYAN